MLYSFYLISTAKVSIKTQTDKQFERKIRFFITKYRICLHFDDKSRLFHSIFFKWGKVMWYFTASILTMTTVRKAMMAVNSYLRSKSEVHTWKTIPPAMQAMA